MFRFSVFLVFVGATYGFHMPGPVYRPPDYRPDHWEPDNVHFPGPTNHHYYYNTMGGRWPNKDKQQTPEPYREPPQISDTTNTSKTTVATTANNNKQTPEPTTEPPKVPDTTISKDTTTSKTVTTISMSTVTSVTTLPKNNNIFNDDEDDECVLDNEPPQADSQCCGVEASSSNNIVGGDTTKLEQYPWLVQIEYYNKKQNRYKRLCGGFLISGRYVLTAAHCLKGEVEELGAPVNIILGEYNSTHEGPDCINIRPGARSCNDGAIKVPIENYMIHPKHHQDKNSSYNDIALVKLSRNVEYTNFIRPICLPTSDLTVKPPDNLSLYVSGWGAIKQRLVFQGGMKNFAGEYDNVKRHVAVPYRDIEDCRSKLGNFVGPGHICAGGERGQDSCRGDSGGPLMYENDGVFEAIGIVSAGSGKKPCGTEGYPAIYTKVYNYLSWIESVTKA